MAVLTSCLSAAAVAFGLWQVCQLLGRKEENAAAVQTFVALEAHAPLQTGNGLIRIKFVAALENLAK